MPSEGCERCIVLQAHEQLAAARARIEELEVDLAAAEEARDELVYHLSPKKPPRPAGSPAPKASQDQLRAALKVGPIAFCDRATAKYHASSETM